MRRSRGPEGQAGTAELLHYAEQHGVELVGDPAASEDSGRRLIAVMILLFLLFMLRTVVTVLALG